MTTFPALIPSGRTFTPGVYPHSTFVGKSGRSSRVRNSNVMLGSQLRLSFSAITEAQMLSILSHYQGRSGTFQSFPLSAAIWNAVSDAIDYQLAGYGWRYIEPPTVEDAMCANAYDVAITLETVPPEGTALPGLNSVGIQSIITTAITGGAASGESSSAAGANLTASASIDYEGGSVAGLAETVNVTLAAGTVTSGAGPSPLNALVGWTLAPGIAFVPGSEDLSLNVNWSLAGGSTSGNPWDPSLITTALWLDANDSVTISTVSGGVSQWTDKSGNSRHGTQSASGQRPTVNSIGINSKPAISFDGSDDRLSFPSGFLNGTTAFTVAMVISGPLQQNDAMWGPSTSFSTGLEMVWTNTASQPTLLRINNANKITAGLWSTNSTPTLTVVTASATATAGWLNGTAVSAASSTGISALNFNGVYTMGSYFNGFNGQMLVAEFIVLESSASTSDRQKLEGYLAHKWGLLGSLPSDHPYKSAAPTA